MSCHNDSGGKPIRRRRAIASLFFLFSACRKGERRPLTVAAAANLTDAFGRIGPAFTRRTGIAAVFSYASTAQLAQQIENAAPFDLFAAADTAHVDRLIRAGKLLPGSRAVYARGELALWVPPGGKARIETLADLAAPAVRFVSIAEPQAAPYGAAAIESLRNAGLWDRVKAKVVYASNINMSKQFAATGNTDAAFTAYPLVHDSPGRAIVIDEKLHGPIDQALGIVAASPRQADARRFASYITRGEGRSILERCGYRTPAL